MSETLTSRKSGYGGRQVSRQLTDSERALDDRVESHLGQAPMQPIAGEERYGYSWLEQDLQQRAMITQQLGQERQLAAQSGQYQDMDRRFNQETEDEADAIEVHRQINGLLATDKNMRRQDAVLAVTKDRPDYWGNKFFTEIEDNMAGAYETDMEREKREGDLRVSILQNELKEAPMGALRDLNDTEEGMRYHAQVAKFAQEQHKHGMKMDERQRESVELTAENQYKQAQLAQRDFDVALQSDNTLDGRLFVVGLAEKNGIEIENTEAAASYFKSNPIAATVVNHPSFVDKIGKEAAAGMFSAIEALQIATDPVERAKAQTIIDKAIAPVYAEIKEVEKTRAIKERARAFGAEVGSSLQDVHDRVAGFVKASRVDAKGNVTGMPVEELEAQSLNEYESWGKNALASSPELRAYLPEWQRLMEDTRKKPKGERAQYARWRADDFALMLSRAGLIAEAKEAGMTVGGTKEVTDSTTAASPSPASGGAPPDKVAKASEYLKRAGNDPAKARELARSEGFEF